MKDPEGERGEGEEKEERGEKFMKEAGGKSEI